MERTTELLIHNPGLQKYDISEYRGLKGANFYLSDAVLRRMLRRHIPADEWPRVDDHLAGFGELVGGVLDDLAREAHKEGKYGYLQKFDSYGNRIDEIVYCVEQREIRRIAYEYGIVNLDRHPEWDLPFRFIHRMSLAYLLNHNGEGGVTCPLAMTEGLIEVLREVGTEEQRKRFLPIVSDPESKSHFMVGQYVTERVGGSNVSANRTVAVPSGNGAYLLYGEKWFCSNPGDVWVTTARIDGTNTIGLFLMSRYRKDGSLNDYHILRTKDIIGSRGKVTAEIEYRGAEAEVLGRPGRGLAYLLQVVLRTSRVHVALSGIGMARRAMLEAISYARHREAYGRKIRDFPLVQRNLVGIKVRQIAALIAVFESWLALDAKSPLAELLVPLLKYKVSSLGTAITREAILTLGGNGIIGDFSVLPRLLNDNIINETWEGTHNILGEHSIKAFRRPRVRKIWKETLHKIAEKIPRDLSDVFDQWNQWNHELEKLMADYHTWSPEMVQVNTLPLCDLIYRVYAGAMLLREATIDADNGSGEFAFGEFALLARAFLDIHELGVDGMVAPGSVLNSPDRMQRIIDFG